MQTDIETRLKELGLTLPEPAAPAFSYVPFTRTGNLVFVSGQVPVQDGKVAMTGKLGEAVSLEDGQKAARICALNLLAHVKSACGGDLSRLKKVLKLTVFIASAPAFSDQPKVANGASDLFVDLFGEAGKHSRSAVGMAALPLDVPVEVEGIFELA